MPDKILHDGSTSNGKTRSVKKSIYLGLFTISGGLLVLTGWLFDIPALKSVLPVFVTMKANTALCFVMAGLSLTLLSLTPPSTLNLRFSRIFAGLTALIGFLTICEYIFSINLGIDQMLFRESVNAVNTLSSGLMALNSAINFLILGCALFIINFRQRVLSAQVLALFIGLLGLLPLFGYVYGATALIGIGCYTQMAIHTAILFMVMSLGILMLYPAEGFMQTITSNTMGGWLLRRLLPFLIIVTFVFGWLRVYGEHHGYFESSLGVALMMVCMMILFTCLIWWTAKKFNRIIADKLQSEGHLHKSEESYRRLFEAARDGILLLDYETGTITDVNQFLIERLGFSHKELLNKRLWEVGFFKDAGLSKDAFLKLQTEGYIRYEDLPLETKDGKKLDVEFISNVYQAGDMKVIQCNIRDISEHKLAEIEKIKLETKLRQSQKLESIGQLAGGIAHDFNNMLSVINGYSEMLLMGIDPSDPKYEPINKIHEAGEHSAALTKQLLAFARKQPIAPKVLDLNEEIESMLKMLRRLLGENIELIWKPSVKLWKVKMDPSQLNQILANLLVNARDAISGTGRIIIETCKVNLDEPFCRLHPDLVPGKYVVLEVGDNGCGMDKETLERVFEPFFTTKEFGKGTGLGLATVFGIVKQNNSSINVYSEPGKGTTFKIYLHRDESEVGKNNEKPEAHKIITGTETILLVEDDTSLLQFAKELLEQLGYTVLAAENPDQAIQLAGEYKRTIHLLMTDLVMPKMSGKNLKVKISEIRSDIKCLFMSGYTAEVMSPDGLLDKGIHFLEKPFSAEELSMKLREALA